MNLLHKRTFLNFDQHVDTTKLLALKPYISAFVARNHHLVKPTKFSGRLFGPTVLGITDYQQQFRDNSEIIPDPELRTVVSDLLNCDQFGNYIVFEQDVTTGTLSLVPRYCKEYHTKHLAEHCVAVPEDSQFGFFYQWLDQQGIFDQYGRVTLYINYPGTNTVTHRDYVDPDSGNLDEFVWINLTTRKRFYVIDNATQQKTYLSGLCNWFNTNHLHGSDPVEQACYSIRVDGVFRESFRQLVLAQ